MIGYFYRDKFARKNAEFKLSKAETWDKLIEFIDLEIKIQEQINLLDKSLSNSRDETRNSEPESKKYNSHTSSTELLVCVLCGMKDHNVTPDHFGRQVVQYFSCKMFVDMTPKMRLRLLYEKCLCYQCLSPGAKVEHGKHKAAMCSKFVCKNKDHTKYPRKKHVLCCEEHKCNAESSSLLEGI